jgi:hypothetical protein
MIASFYPLLPLPLILPSRPATNLNSHNFLKLPICTNMLKTCSFRGLQVSQLTYTKAYDFSFDPFHGSLVIFILIILSMITLYLRIY